MPEPLSPDFLIIGAGIIGLSSAFELARRGAKVTIIDRGIAGHESSWAGGGILSALLPWEYSAPVNRLISFGTSGYAAWVEDIEARSGLSAEYVVSGMNVLPPFDRAAMSRWLAEDKNRGHTLEDGTLFLPAVAQVRPPRLLAALVNSLVQMGVDIRENLPAIRLEQDAKTVSGVVTPTGKLSAGKYILTSGAWTCNLLNINNNFKPVRGQMLLFKASAGLLKHIIYRDGVYVIPRRDGHILVGSTVENAGFDQSITAEAKRTLHAAGVEMFPALVAATFVSQWAGLRPGSPGNLPLIDRHPQWENCFVNTGHFRYGLTMAPAAAHLLVCKMLDETPPIPLAPYSWPHIV